MVKLKNIYMHLASAVCLVSFIIYWLSISQLIYCVMTAILVGSQFCNIAFLLKCTCVKHCHIHCSQEDSRTASSARSSLSSKQWCESGGTCTLARYLTLLACLSKRVHQIGVTVSVSFVRGSYWIFLLRTAYFHCVNTKLWKSFSTIVGMCQVYLL